MNRKLIFVAMTALVPLVLMFGCGEQAPESTPAPVPQKVASPQAKQGQPVTSAEIVPEPEPPKYRYESIGRRDPFESLFTVKKPVAAVEEPLTPLQRFDLGQLRLLGVIIGKGEPRAMVVAPDGKSYILKKGIKVGKNDGSVVEITEEAVMVEEHYVDFSGEVRTGKQEIALPRQGGVE